MNTHRTRVLAKSRVYRAALAGSACLLALASAHPALAQTEQAADTGALEDIVVTAQKRSQNVQDTPISVTAIGGAKLQSAGITEVQELNRIDPALQIGKATGVVTTFIRGIGNPVTTAGNEASVPIYIDDVYFIRAAFPFFDLASIDRVEVLKGPQGTLFGRNASGGVISIYTRDPDTDKAALEVHMGYGNYETMDGKLYVNLPVTSRLAANFSLSYHDQNEGWGRNKKLIDRRNPSLGYKAGGEDYWKGHSISMRGKILWEPTDTTTIKLIGYYEASHSQIGIYSRPFPGTAGGSPDAAHNGFPAPLDAPTPSQALPPLRFYDVSLDQEQYDDSSGGGGSVRVDQELGFADLVSITAYRKADELYYSAGNYSDYNWLRYDLNVVDKQFSQELQLKSKPSSKVVWILGGYYLNADGGFNPTTIRGPGPNLAGLQGINIYGQQKVKSYAAFGQLTYPITDTTNITAGLRYNHDEVSGNGHTDLVFLPGVAGPDAVTVTDQKFDANNACSNLVANLFSGGLAPITGTCNAPNPNFRKKINKLTYKASIDHKLSDRVMAYASYSRGYKAGTFNTLPLDSPALQPEIVDAYEIGVKSQFLDNRVRLNAALFWNDIGNPQVQAQRNGLVFLTNAGSARTRGGEFDMSFAATSDLTLRIAGSYLDAKFRSFADVDGNGTVDCPTYRYSTIAPGNLDQSTTSCNGNRMPYTSKWKFSGGANYEHDIGDAGKLALDLNANWASSFPWDADNVIREQSHFLLDGSIAFTPASLEHLTLRFWMKNITKEKYNINYYAQASGSAYSTAPGAPRTFGGEIIFNF